jgi:hypothetical protein
MKVRARTCRSVAASWRKVYRSLRHDGAFSRGEFTGSRSGSHSTAKPQIVVDQQYLLEVVIRLCACQAAYLLIAQPSPA